jgi:hypothetical protein
MTHPLADLDDPADPVGQAIEQAARRPSSAAAARPAQNKTRRTLLIVAAVVGGLTLLLIIIAVLLAAFGGSSSNTRAALEPTSQLTGVETPAFSPAIATPPPGPPPHAAPPPPPRPTPAAQPNGIPKEWAARPEPMQKLPETSIPAPRQPEIDTGEIQRLTERVVELEAQLAALKRQPAPSLDALQRQLADLRAIVKEIKPAPAPEKEKPAAKELPVSPQWQLRSVSENNTIIYATAGNGGEYTRFSVGDQIPGAGKLIRIVRDATGAFAQTTTHKIVMPN